MNQPIRLKTTTSPLLIVAFIGFVFLPQTRAVNPPPDGGYPGFNTAEGQNALLQLTTGVANTAIGWYSISLAAGANYNTGVGAGALALTSGAGVNSNTAVGTGAMLLNTIGQQNVAVGIDALAYNESGGDNNAVGAFTLLKNISGSANSAFGYSALHENISGAENTAIGHFALFYNDMTGAGLGNFNTAVGAEALFSNTDGDSNIAVGSRALYFNDTGFFNTAVGSMALENNSDGGGNIAVGYGALSSNTGNINTAIGTGALELLHTGWENTAIGYAAGGGLTGAETGNIYIGSRVFGSSGENDTIRIGSTSSGTNACFIKGIYGLPYGPADMAVRVGNDGQLGTVVSSRRFKHDIKPMDIAREAILALKPATFQYNSDKTNTPHFGLIAEEVAEVNPDLIVRDEKGKPLSVRYEDINVMLLNEFLKEHKKVQGLEATMVQQRKNFESRLAQQEKQIELLTAGLQKVSAQVQMSRPAPQVVTNP